MNALTSSLFYLKRAIANPREIPFSRQLQASQKISTDELSSRNLQLRRELVSFAFEHIPHYRKKYKQAGFEPGDMRADDFFPKLPILEKQEIRENESALLNPDIRKAKLPVSTTGGSTGRPLRTYHDPRIPSSVISWRTLNWWGTDVSTNSGYLYRNVPKGWRKQLQQVLLWPTRRYWISAAHMGNSQMDRFFQDLATSKAEYLIGYVGAVDVFSSFMKQHDYQLPSLKAVWTTSAPLPELKRHIFERIFQCPVYTQYGSCEFYWIAAECSRKSGLHIASDVRHVEIVEDNRPMPDEEYGDIIVSDLLNRAFPLIRYRLGDRGRLLQKHCPCGLPFPMMDYIDGRATDIIWTKSHQAIPVGWTTIFNEFPDVIKSFQIHQRADYTVVIRYETHPDIDCEPAICAVRSRLERRYGKDLVFSFEAAQLDVNDNGKTRFVTSEIEPTP